MGVHDLLNSLHLLDFHLYVQMSLDARRRVDPYGGTHVTLLDPMGEAFGSKGSASLIVGPYYTGQ